MASCTLRPVPAGTETPDAPAEYEARGTEWNPRFLGWLLAAVTLLMFFWGLGSIPLTSPNEGLYAQISREMLQRGDFIVPHINGLLYFEKPPLLYWLVAGCMRVFGLTAWAARLPSVTAGLVTVLLIWWLGQELLGKTGGLLSAIIAATGIGFVLMARQVMFDALQTACITLAMVGFWLAARELAAGRRPAPWLIYLAYLGLALAILAKGFLGLLPLCAILVYAIVARDFRCLRALWSPGAILLFLAVAVPWHVMVAQREPIWTWYYFVNEHLYRLLGKRQPADFHVGAVYLPAAGILLLLFPWSLLSPAVMRFTRPDPADPRLTRADLLFLQCWFWFPLVFFTLSKTRALYYEMPIMPPLALLLGLWWRDLPGVWGRLDIRRWVLVPQVFFIFVCLAVFLVSLAGALKNLGDIGPRTLLMMSSGVWMLAGSIIVVVLLTRRRFAAAFTAQTLTVLVTCVAALGLAAKTGAATTEDQLAQIVADGPQPAGLQVAMQRHFEDHSSFGFYLPRSAFPLHIVQGRWGGDLQFGSSREPELFLSQDQFRTWASSRPVYLLTESPPKLSVPQGFHVAGRQNQAMLWANFPKMKGGGWVARPQDAGYPS